MHLLHARKVGTKTVKIYLDPEPINPQEDGAPTEILHWHPRYDLGTRIDPSNETEIREDAEEKGDPILAALPVSLYDHSGISMRVGAYRSFDSGQVGWAVIRRSSALYYGFDLDSDTCEETLLEAIRVDVEMFDAYLTGQVFGFVVEGAAGDNLDSCWGFFDVNDCEEQGIYAAKGCNDPAVDLEAEALQSRATLAIKGYDYADYASDWR